MFLKSCSFHYWRWIKNEHPYYWQQIKTQSARVLQVLSTKKHFWSPNFPNWVEFWPLFPKAVLKWYREIQNLNLSVSAWVIFSLQAELVICWWLLVFFKNKRQICYIFKNQPIKLITLKNPTEQSCCKCAFIPLLVTFQITTVPFHETQIQHIFPILAIL